MKRVKSSVWDFFNRSNDKKNVNCSLCKRDYKYHGNTTNMKKHLQRLHPIQFLQNNNGNSTVSENQDDDNPDVGKKTIQNRNRSDSFENLPSTSSYVAKDTTETQIEIIESAESSVTVGTKRQGDVSQAGTKTELSIKRPRQLKLFGARCKNELLDKQKSVIDHKLIKMITFDYQPLSIVENEGFREYTHALNENYTLPNRKLLTEKMIPDLYEESASKLNKQLDNVKHLSVTTDIWTSDSNRAYISVTIHFIYNDQLYSNNVATREIFGSHTGENIGNTLTTIFNEWKIYNKVITVVSDNASNIKKSY